MNQYSVPFSASADRNKEAIGDALEEYLLHATSVLEIGSGTAQHAVYLCKRFDHLQWQPTEQPLHLDGLQVAVKHAALDEKIKGNIRMPLELEVSAAATSTPLTEVPGAGYSIIYSANTAHIMGIDEVEAMFTVVSRYLHSDGHFALYGPFKENGQHNSAGNEDFDVSLRTEKPAMGIRDIAELEAFAVSVGMTLLKQIAMPANNRILLWQKLPV